MFDLSGKVAVVTGAGSGIGRGIALKLAEAGADVVTSDLYLDRAEETAGLVLDIGRQSLAIRADVREQESVQAMAEATVRTFGRLDVCVANAGIGRGGSVLSLAESDWNIVIQTNLTGVFLTVQACAREMVRAGNGGRVIIISSVAAERALARGSAYSASKAAIRHAGNCWSLDLASFDITVNSIGPGYVESRLTTDIIGDGEARESFEERIPLHRAGTPEDIGYLACWLASDEASWVTGTFNMTDGGSHETASSIATIMQNRKQIAGYSGDELLDMLDADYAEQRENFARRREEIGLA